MVAAKKIEINKSEPDNRTDKPKDVKETQTKANGKKKKIPAANQPTLMNFFKKC